jgi:hypothetical protein
MVRDDESTGTRRPLLENDRLMATTRSPGGIHAMMVRLFRPTPEKSYETGLDRVVYW